LRNGVSVRWREAKREMAKREVKSTKKPPRRDMRAAERERFIVDEAVRFFAEQGFGGQTREFAKRMGITYPRSTATSRARRR
jgi:hypothetical protein